MRPRCGARIYIRRPHRRRVSRRGRADYGRRGCAPSRIPQPPRSPSLKKLFSAAAALFLLCPVDAEAATPWDGSTNIDSGDRIVTLAQGEAVLTDAFADANRIIV